MIKILLDNNKEFRAEVRYVFETFFEIIGTPAVFVGDLRETEKDDILIYYGKRRPAINCHSIVVPESDWALWKSSRPKLKFIDGIPVISEEILSQERLIVEDDLHLSYTVSFDIIAASFYFLSRQEERTNRKRDLWGCFAENFSVTHDWALTQVPFIDIYIEMLAKLIMKLAEARGRHVKLFPRWKDNKKFAVALTHDVDNARKYTIVNAAKLFLKKVIRKEGDFGEILEVLNAAVNNKRISDPYFSFDDFMGIESRFGNTSTFFVLSQSLNRKYDPFYSLDNHLGRQLRDIFSKGWDIGLHGSYDSFESEVMLKGQKTRMESVLKKPVTGIRQHYLRFSIENTFSAQEKSGFIYDSTLGYNEDIGFRAAMAKPFFPFDANEKKKLGILELPLSIMDGSLFNFRHYNAEQAFNSAKKLIDQVERVGGLVVILWHTKARDQKDFPGWWDVYRQILEYLHTRDAWVTNAGQIADWWLDRVKNVRNCRDN